MMIRDSTITYFQKIICMLVVLLEHDQLSMPLIQHPEWIVE
jgi:hypothetical protein